MEKLKKLFSNTAFDGILLIILGVILLINPGGTMDIICFIIGIILLIMAAVRFITYARNKEERSNGSFFLAILLTIVGIILIAKPTLFTNIVPIAFALLIGYGAVVSMMQLYNKKKAGLRAPAISWVLAIVTLVLAVVVLFNPATSLNTFIMFVGAAIILAGISLLSSSGGKSAQK